MGIGASRLFIFKTKKINRTRKHFRVIALLAVPALSFWFFFRSASSNFSARQVQGISSSLPFEWNPQNARFSAMPESLKQPIYRYSVIPGGARSREELQDAVRRDPVVASHYSGFRGPSVHVVRLAAPHHVYVSYRFGNHIYWTRNTVTLFAGETLLTDGTNYARTRCGNRISETPRGPNLPAEPVSEDLDRPVRPELDPLNLPSALLTREDDPFLVALNPPYAPGRGPVPPLFPVVPLVPCCGPSAPSPKSPVIPRPPLPPPPNPVVTPEPPALLLFIVGTAGTLLIWTLRRS
jgi:hypothetical protein